MHCISIWFLLIVFTCIQMSPTTTTVLLNLVLTVRAVMIWCVCVYECLHSVCMHVQYYEYRHTVSIDNYHVT